MDLVLVFRTCRSFCFAFLKKDLKISNSRELGSYRCVYIASMAVWSAYGRKKPLIHFITYSWKACLSGTVRGTDCQNKILLFGSYFENKQAPFASPHPDPPHPCLHLTSRFLPSPASHKPSWILKWEESALFGFAASHDRPTPRDSKLHLFFFF